MRRCCSTLQASCEAASTGCSPALRRRPEPPLPSWSSKPSRWYSGQSADPIRPRSCRLAAQPAGAFLPTTSPPSSRSSAHSARFYASATRSGSVSPPTPGLEALEEMPGPPTRSRFKAGPYAGALLARKPPPSPSLVRATKSLLPSAAPGAVQPPQLSKLHFAHSDVIQDHLQQLLYPLKFDVDVACRMVTSKAAAEATPEADVGFHSYGDHSDKLAFLGRRMLHFNLSAFLASAPRDRARISPASPALSQAALDDLLDPRAVLGYFVGRAWGLEKIMRWREMSAPVDKAGTKFAGTGLWAARGQAVEAVVGGVMARHGARLATAVFHSLVLPHLEHRIGPEYSAAIRAVSARDQELGDPKAGRGALGDLDVFGAEEARIEREADARRPAPRAALAA